MAKQRITAPQTRNPYVFSAYRASAASYSTGFSKYVIDTVEYDPNSNYSTANSRYTAPVAGVYTFKARVSNSGSQAILLALYKNGVEVKRGQDLNLGSASKITSLVDADIQLAAGDYVEAWLYVGASATIDIGSVFSYFQGKFVG